MNKYVITYEFEARQLKTTIEGRSPSESKTIFYKSHSKKCEIISIKKA